MKNDTVKILLVIVGIVFGILLLTKTFVAIWNSSFELAGFLLTALNVVLNLIGIIVAIAGPIVVIMIIGSLIGRLGKIALDEINSLNDKISEVKYIALARAKELSPILLPILLAGVVQIILVTLSKDFAPNNTKAMLTIFLWAGITLTLMTFSTKGKIRLVGVFGIILLVSTIGIYLYYRYELSSWEIVNTYWLEMLEKIKQLSLVDGLSIAVLVSAIVLMVTLAIVLGVARIRSANKALNLTGAENAPSS